MQHILFRQGKTCTSDLTAYLCKLTQIQYFERKSLYNGLNHLLPQFSQISRLVIFSLFISDVYAGITLFKL